MVLDVCDVNREYNEIGLVVCCGMRGVFAMKLQYWIKEMEENSSKPSFIRDHHEP